MQVQMVKQRLALVLAKGRLEIELRWLAGVSALGVAGVAASAAYGGELGAAASDFLATRCDIQLGEDAQHAAALLLQLLPGAAALAQPFPSAAKYLDAAKDAERALGELRRLLAQEKSRKSSP